MAAYVKPVIKTIETASQLFAAAGTGLVISGVPQNCRIWRVRALRSASAGVTFTEFEIIKTATTPTVAVGSSATTQLRANNAAAANPMDWTPSNPIMVHSVLANPGDGTGPFSVWVNPNADWTGILQFELEVCA